MTSAPKTNVANGLIYGGLAMALIVVVGFMGGLWRYKATPGAGGTAPPFWPAASGIERAAQGPTLLMFAHPKCACTQASLAELRGVLEDGGMDATVLFAIPDDLTEDWTHSAAWELAASIPRLKALPDHGERAAHLFGARTSGQVVVYDAAGRLMFAGGITAARGHVGDNLGRQQVANLARGSAADASQTPVYGCALADAEVSDAR